MEILSNVKRLKETVNDIELLFFESANIPLPKVVNELKKVAKEGDLTYTVHLPLDLKLADTDMKVRRASVEEVIRIIEKAEYLNPHSYILHVDMIGRNAGSRAQWQTKVSASIKKIIENVNIKPARICIENLDYPLEYLDSIIDKLKLSVCLDMGHLLKHSFNIQQYFEKYIDNTRVIHLYGQSESGLHSSLKKLDRGLITWLMEFLHHVKYMGILTLEVFSESDLEESLRLIKIN